MAEYTYDEEGFNFYYFLLSVLSLSLAPFTFYSIYTGWKHSRSNAKRCCHCRACHDARMKKRAAESGNAAVKTLTSPKFLFMLLGWIAVAFLAYQVSFAEAPKARWDPYDILGINEGATMAEIKKVYKKLSLVYHPDKAQAGTEKESEERFIQISKAYQVLTDEDVRKNYEQYGHPDGKQSFTMGVALPRKLVEGHNSKLVLVFYGLVFGIGLPYYIARWWHESRRRNKGNVLHSTMGVFFKGLREDDDFEELVTLLTGAREFQENISMREGEDEVLRKLDASVSEALMNLTCEEYEPLDPKVYPDYRRKVATLLYAHFFRVPVPGKQLLQDQSYIVEKSTQALSGMLDIAIAKQWLNITQRIIDLQQHLVQATYPGEPSIKQLPHISKIEGKTVDRVQTLLNLDTADRDAFLSGLSQDERLDVTEVANRIPKLSIQKAAFEVIGDEIVTTGSLVTFVLKLKNGESSDEGSKGKAPAKTPAEEEEEASTEEPLPLAHAPHYPGEKKPSWWVLLGDFKAGRIRMPPKKVTDFVSEKIEIPFAAPPSPGTYTFTLIVKSDTYLDTDNQVDVKLVVCDPSELPDEDPIDDSISEPDEDSIAGQMKLMREQGLASALAGGQKDEKTAGAADSDSDTDSDSSDDD